MYKIKKVPSPTGYTILESEIEDGKSRTAFEFTYIYWSSASKSCIRACQYFGFWKIWRNI